MSEYWVSHKKYFCKYCDIYIADDAPSRQQHESGLRHKGNRERFVRGLYKQGERAKKDLEEEKREIARIEAAANAAYARDISSGNASASSTSRPTKQDTAPAAKKPERPSSAFSDYSTAQSLGYTDPDEERLKAEEERRRSQGRVGEWQVVAPPPPPLPGGEQEGEEDVKEGIMEDGGALKRPADAPAGDTDDGRTFKLRKKTLGAGLDDIWDPGDIPIKLKSNKTGKASPVPDPTKSDDSAVATGPEKSADAAQKTEQSGTSMPKWKPTAWKSLDPSNSTDDTETRGNPGKDESSSRPEEPPVRQKLASINPSPERLTQDQEQQIADADQPVSVKAEVKEEQKQDSLVQEPMGGLFRKRKLPSGVRGRR